MLFTNALNFLLSASQSEKNITESFNIWVGSDPHLPGEIDIDGYEWTWMDMDWTWMDMDGHGWTWMDMDGHEWT